MQNLLFVCLGNICRSPTAKAMFDYKLARAGIKAATDSAGTIGYHVGHPPDPRSIEHAQSWGIDISSERARRVVAADFQRFDRIFAMDRSNLAELEAMAPDDGSARIELVMTLVPDYGLDEVPDPYYGSGQGFRQVIDMLEAAADRLVEELTAVR